MNATAAVRQRINDLALIYQAASRVLADRPTAIDDTLLLRSIAKKLDGKINLKLITQALQVAKNEELPEDKGRFEYFVSYTSAVGPGWAVLRRSNPIKTEADLVALMQHIASKVGVPLVTLVNYRLI